MVGRSLGHVRLASAGILLVAAATASVLPARAAAPAAPPLGPAAFSTPTIIDPFRQGYEPDISVDQKTGAMYSSVPNGTPGTSSLYRSDDGGHDWRLVDDNVQGEPSSCAPVAGGDTELAIDPADSSLYYSDLQPLTNFNASVSHDTGKTFACNHLSVADTGVDRQWYAVDSDGGQHPVTGGGGGRLYFDYDDIGSNPGTPGNNVLVINASTDGLLFGSACPSSLSPCTGGSTRISTNEGLPGNLVVDDTAGSPHQHSIYALHSSADLGGVILTRCDGSGPNTTAVAAQAYCFDPTAIGTGTTNTHWSDHTVFNSDVNGVQKDIVANNFTTIAVDTAGNLYALWADYPGSVTSNPVQGTYNYTGTGRLLLSTSTDGGTTWSSPAQIPGPASAPGGLPNNTQPWLTAGSSGRVAVAWYGAPQAQGPDNSYGPDGLTNGVWDVYVAENLDVLGSGTWSVTKVSDHPAKLGAVSTEGLQLPSGPDRSLGDFMKITHDASGAVSLVYVDDNTNLWTAVQNSGPTVAVHQVGGPSLLAGHTVPVQNDIHVNGTTTDPTGDARATFGGQAVNGSPALDITASSVSLLDPTHLKVTMTVNDPNLIQHLAPDPTLGGATSNVWAVRWDFDPATQPANQTIGGFFTAMEFSTSSGLSFYDGGILSSASPVAPTLYTYSYPAGHPVNGGINGNTITWVVPTGDVGGPAAGQTLFETQAFTASEAIPAQPNNDVAGLGLYNTGGAEIAPNLVDQAPSFDAPLAIAPLNVAEAPSIAALLTAGAVAVGVGGLVRRRRRKGAAAAG